MAYAYVQEGHSGPASAGLTATVTINNVAQGALLVLFSKVSSSSRSISGVSDGTNTWAFATSKTGAGGPARTCQVWYAANCTAGSYTITVTYDSAAADTAVLAVLEYSGILTVSPKDQSSSANTGASAASVSSGSITPTQDGSLMFTCSFSETTSRPLTSPSNSGYAKRLELTAIANEMEIGDYRQATIAADSVTWAVTGGNAQIHAFIVSFKEIVTTSAVPVFVGGYRRRET